MSEPPFQPGDKVKCLYPHNAVVQLIAGKIYTIETCFRRQGWFVTLEDGGHIFLSAERFELVPAYRFDTKFQKYLEERLELGGVD